MIPLPLRPRFSLGRRVFFVNGIGVDFMLRTNVVSTVGPLSEASEGSLVNLFEYCKPLLGLRHMAIHHAFQRLRVL